MSRISNRTYHESRAEDELQRAEEATDPAVAKIHRQLAVLHRRQMLAVVDEVQRILPVVKDDPEWRSQQGA